MGRSQGPAGKGGSGRGRGERAGNAELEVLLGRPGLGSWWAQVSSPCPEVGQAPPVCAPSLSLRPTAKTHDSQGLRQWQALERPRVPPRGAAYKIVRPRNSQRCGKRRG